ncbi:MAG: MarR family transcriptional regulator [Reyranellaceae bacterium]
MRLALQRVRRQMDHDVRAAGFADLQPAHAPILSYPPPDGVRLSALARRVGMTPQAANYLVSQLEEMGYLERRAVGEASRRLIFLTRRGHHLVETFHASLRALEAKWAREVGQERFDTFMDVLRELDADAAPT